MVCADITVRNIRTTNNHISKTTDLFAKNPIIKRIEKPNEFKSKFGINLYLNLKGGAEYKIESTQPITTRRKITLENRKEIKQLNKNKKCEIKSPFRKVNSPLEIGFFAFESILKSQQLFILYP